jgi:hypothetical protein
VAVHIYTRTLRRTTQITTKKHWVRSVPRLCEFYPGICHTTEENSRKNLCQGKKNLSQVKKNLSQGKKNLSQVKKNLSKGKKKLSQVKKNLSHSTVYSCSWMTEGLSVSQEVIYSMASWMYADRLRSRQPKFYPQFHKHNSEVRLSVCDAYLSIEMELLKEFYLHLKQCLCCRSKRLNTFLQQRHIAWR